MVALNSLMCLAIESQIAVLFIEHVWGLKRPELVISITGSAEEFSMGEDREKVLDQLMETARCSSGWMVTGGTCAGIMKYVGRQTSHKHAHALIYSYTTACANERLLECARSICRIPALIGPGAGAGAPPQGRRAFSLVAYRRSSASHRGGF